MIKIIPIVLLIIFSCSQSQYEIYGPIKKHEYLAGRFKPENCTSPIKNRQNGFFVELNKFGIKTNGSKHYLRVEAARALQKMTADFKKAHPDIPLWVQSSTRNFTSQKWIWEMKFNGKTKVDGKNLALTIKDKRQRALRILQYSSMPGTSRHHWGTDFDINILDNDYYKKGKGKIIFDWLTAHAADYGFCQPYTADRKQGYYEERWHWSYLPLSKTFLKDWNKLHTINPQLLIPPDSFAGSDSAADLAPLYVNAISPLCK